MNAPTIIILAIIAVCAIFAGRRMFASFSGKGGCHGGGGGPKVKRVRVTDTNKDNYPYSEDIKIGGMTCAHCVTNVENALNGIEGTWAHVDLTSGVAHILSKTPVDAATVKDAVSAAGYYVVREQ